MNVQQATIATQVWANAYQSAGEAASREEHFGKRLLIAQAKAGRSNAFSELLRYFAKIGRVRKLIQEACYSPHVSG
jgi:hypothetical protein